MATAPTGSPVCQAPTTVLLAYRDAEHELLGKTFWQDLSPYLNGVDCVRVTEWKFEMIASLALNRLATAEAREASLVLLAADSDEGLPEKVRTWLADWCAHQSSPGFLVVLLTENLPGLAAHWPDYSRLIAQARKTGTELVLCPVSAAAEQRNASPFAQSWRVSPTGLVLLRDVPDLATLVRGCLKAQTGGS